MNFSDELKSICEIYSKLLYLCEDRKWELENQVEERERKVNNLVTNKKFPPTLHHFMNHFVNSPVPFERSFFLENML